MSKNNFNTSQPSDGNEFIELIHKLEHNRLIDSLFVEKLSQPYRPKAAIYCRVSLKAQAKEDKVSLEEQKVESMALIKKKEMDFFKCYQDKGISGTHIEGRKAFQELIEDAKEKKFDVVVAWATDRLARNVDEMTALRAEFKKYNVQITTVSEPSEIVDPRIFNPNKEDMSRILTFLLDWKAEQDNVTRVKRFQIGKMGKARKGKIPVKVPYGMRKVVEYENGDPKKKIETDVVIEDQALVVSEIYDLYDKKSWGMRKIAEHLNLKGIPSPRGKKWCYSTIKYMLQNPTFTGLVRYGWRLSESKKSRARLQQGHEGIITHGSHTPIIGEEQYKRVQEKMAIRKKLGGKAVSSKGLLTGILKCGRCGGGTYLSKWPHWLAYEKDQSERDKYKEVAVYLCSNYAQYGRSGCTKRYVVSAPKIEGIVAERIAKLASSEEARKEFAKQMKKNNTKSLKSKLSNLNKAVVKVDEKIQRIKIAYTNGAISLEEFGQDRKVFEDEKNGLLKEIEETTIILMKEERIAQQSEIALFALADFEKSWQTASFSERKELLQVLLEKIVVKDKDIQLFFAQNHE